MTNREQKLNEELLKCRDNIKRTKELIAYHKDILRKQERKAAEISAKLDKEKMKSLLGMIHKDGLDIDNLRQAVSNGKFSVPPAEPIIENIKTEYNVEISKEEKKCTD